MATEKFDMRTLTSIKAEKPKKSLGEIEKNIAAMAGRLNGITQDLSMSSLTAPNPARIELLNAELQTLQEQLLYWQNELEKHQRWLNDCGFLNKPCKNRNRDKIKESGAKIATLSARIAEIRDQDLPQAKDTYNKTLQAWKDAKLVEAETDPEIIQTRAEAKEQEAVRQQSIEKQEATNDIKIILTIAVAAAVVIAIGIFTYKKLKK